MVAICALSTAHAELTWEQKNADVTATAGMEMVETRFRFTNTGTTPVDIRQVESSCGCTTTQLAERHYGPGQSGEIVARYTVGGHMGLRKNTIAVSSSDQAEITTLKFDVHIPEIAHLQPEFVTWAHDEATAPKTIELDMLQDISPKDIAVQSSNTGVTAVMETLVKDHKYQIVVTPARTSQFVHAVLTVHCRFGDKEQTFRTYATVQPPLSRE